MFWGYLLEIPEVKIPEKMHPRQLLLHRCGMRLAIGSVIVMGVIAPLCLAQQWELGGAGGYSSYINPSINGPAGSVEPGFAPKGMIGVVFGQNMYEHIGGEIRWLYQYGGPELTVGGAKFTSTGYTNVVTYDVLFHTSNREAALRPYFAGGAGIKVFTASQFRNTGQIVGGTALIARETQVEPAISAGAGLKYSIAKHALIRVDFRTYFSPCPDRVFRPIGSAFIRGWTYNFVPLGGISFVF